MISTNNETGSVLFRFYIAYIANKGTICDILLSGDRDVLLSDELGFVGGLFDAATNPIVQTSKFIC